MLSTFPIERYYFSHFSVSSNIHQNAKIKKMYFSLCKRLRHGMRCV
ncbi:hypothetical protein PROVRETT_09199 [Providencia rettgeri DSM 1131]|nr:hypothetical protein PROVRETT_09199 [Providencia rettgeri DSM 1131]